MLAISKRPIGPLDKDLTAKAPSKTKSSKAEKQRPYGSHRKSVQGKELKYDNHQTKEFPLKASRKEVIKFPSRTKIMRLLL
jgi:hypothetical protein